MNAIRNQQINIISKSECKITCGFHNGKSVEPYLLEHYDHADVVIVVAFMAETGIMQLPEWARNALCIHASEYFGMRLLHIRKTTRHGWWLSDKAGALPCLSAVYIRL
jgi:hypothetical protein